MSHIPGEPVVSRSRWVQLTNDCKSVFNYIEKSMILQNSLQVNFFIHYCFSSPLTPHAVLSPAKGKQFKIAKIKCKNLSCPAIYTCHIPQGHCQHRAKEWLWGFLRQVRWSLGQQSHHTCFLSDPASLTIQRLTVNYISNHFFHPDNESDTEVPYADIMITVRGVSTPELTQVSYLTPGDQKEVRDETSGSTCLSFLFLLNPKFSLFSSVLSYEQLFATVDHIRESKAGKWLC